MAFLRPTEPTDVSGILALVAEVYAEYGCTLDTEHDAPYLLVPGSYFRATGGEFWVVEDDGVVRGTGGVLLHPDAGELKTLYVHQSLRGQGWGRALTLQAIAHARQAGKPRFFLWSDTRFLTAHRLYHRLGFHQYGSRELHDVDDSIEYGFELALTADDRRGAGD